MKCSESIQNFKKRKIKNYLDYLIREGATDQEIEEIQTKYDLEYKVALEIGFLQNSKSY